MKFNCNLDCSFYHITAFVNIYNFTLIINYKVLKQELETNRAAIYGSAMGACIGSGKKWTVEDSIKLEGTIRALDRRKNR